MERALWSEILGKKWRTDMWMFEAVINYRSSRWRVVCPFAERVGIAAISD